MDSKYETEYKNTSQFDKINEFSSILEQNFEKKLNGSLLFFGE
jgi:hypothetical protein